MLIPLFLYLGHAPELFVNQLTFQITVLARPSSAAFCSDVSDLSCSHGRNNQVSDSGTEQCVVAEVDAAIVIIRKVSILKATYEAAAFIVIWRKTLVT